MKIKNFTQFVNEAKTSNIIEIKGEKEQYSISDITKLKKFATEVSVEILDAYEDDFDKKSKNLDADNYTPKEMFDYILDWGKENKLTVKQVISEFNWKVLTGELGLVN